METNETKQNVKHRGISKHMLIMILCCLIPIVTILALSLAGVKSAALSYAIILICPVSMIFMMVFMNKKNGDGNSHH